MSNVHPIKLSTPCLLPSFPDKTIISVSLQGKLIKAWPGATDNWNDVVELMREEFTDSGQDHSLEGRIIRTSLSAIKGSHREKILR